MFVNIDNIILNTNEVVLIRKYSSACICVVVKSLTSADSDNAHVMALDTLTPEQFISSFMDAIFTASN
jgi:hypothetical protein